MKIGNRPMSRLIKSIFQTRHYLSFIHSFTVYKTPVRNLFRYFFNKGKYPYKIELLTRTGEESILLNSSHDLLTVNEIFCREDYGREKNARVIVDIGSNIGISALYFLTQNPKSRLYLFEPLPENVTQIRNNLKKYESRYILEECCIYKFTGEVNFQRESTGRYGGISALLTGTLLPCKGINEILENILQKERQIDILKIDIEGHELTLLYAIKQEYLSRIKKIYIECMNHPLFYLAGFRSRKYGDIHIYERKRDDQ